MRPLVEKTITSKEAYFLRTGNEKVSLGSLGRSGRSAVKIRSRIKKAFKRSYEQPRATRRGGGSVFYPLFLCFSRSRSPVATRFSPGAYKIDFLRLSFSLALGGAAAFDTYLSCQLNSEALFNRSAVVRQGKGRGEKV